MGHWHRLCVQSFYARDGQVMFLPRYRVRSRRAKPKRPARKVFLLADDHQQKRRLVTHVMAAVSRTRRMDPSWSVHLASRTRSGARDTARCLVGGADFAGSGQSHLWHREKRAMASQYQTTIDRYVTLSHSDQEWQVVVEEPGYGKVVRSFRNEQWAWNFAQGQAIRLRIATVARL